MATSWSIPGFNSEPILGTTDLTEGNPRGVILIAHGFKGYKDYGMFPRIAAECAAAGFIAHRFNFSHSGMTNRLETFERPDLFERDTWNKQVLDLRAAIGAMSQGVIAGQGLPYLVLGHSRGGVTALLTAGRFADDSMFPQPAGVIAAAAPATCNPLSADEANLLLEHRFLDSPSSRTGQRLRLGKAFLQEQLDDPAAHDLLMQVGRIRCPILLIHGTADATVPSSAATALKSEAKTQASLVLIPGGDHVFDTPNPFPNEAMASPQLQQVIDAVIGFVKSLT